jgi:putative ABC transport system ATP-binding protein
VTPAVSIRSGEEAAVRIEDLQYFYGEGDTRTQTLFDIDLEISKGEVVFIVGPSGCGKTTLLTLIGTLRSVQDGSVEVAGHQLRGVTPSQIVQIRRDLGFIFQAHNLFDSLTVQQNVRMATELFSLNRKEQDSRIHELLTVLGLGDRLRYKPGNLSGGQKQRVAVARGMVHRPKVILADEPTAALDEASSETVLKLFQQRAEEQGCTVLVVTHDRTLDKFADRIIHVDRGRIKSNVLMAVAEEICRFMRNVPVLAELSAERMTEVAYNVALEKYPAGAVVFRQGEPGDKVYIIRSGSVDVVREEAAGPRTIATLDKGKIFGEMALLNDEPRNASVVAAEDLEVYSLDREHFQQVLETSPTFEEELRQIVFARH